MVFHEWNNSHTQSCCLLIRKSTNKEFRVQFGNRYLLFCLQKDIPLTYSVLCNITRKFLNEEISEKPKLMAKCSHYTSTIKVRNLNPYSEYHYTSSQNIFAIDEFAKLGFAKQGVRPKPKKKTWQVVYEIKRFGDHWAKR